LKYSTASFSTFSKQERDRILWLFAARHHGCSCPAHNGHLFISSVIAFMSIEFFGRSFVVPIIWSAIR
jgi:hypothetical protein